MNVALRTIPLIARVTIALLLVAALPLGYAVWSLFDLNRAGMHEQVLRTHAVAATTAAERISSALEASRSRARAIAGSEPLIADPRSSAAHAFLQEMLASDPTIAMADLVTPGGEVVIRAQHRRTAEQTAHETAASGAPRERIWSTGSGSWLLVSEALPDGRGFARVLTGAEAVTAALDPAEIGEHAEMILASEKGQLLAGEGSVASFPQPMRNAARSSRVNGSGVYADSAGGEVLGAFAPVPGTGWAVLSRQPAVLAERIAGSMRRKAAVAVAVAVFLALLIVTAAQRSLVAPLREVIASQRQLAGGPVPAGSEVDQLRAGTDLLRRRITDQESLGRVFLGRYQVLDLIGQGGGGAVFRGWDPRLQRQIALKTIRFDRTHDGSTQEVADSLAAEAIRAASVSHPNIVAVYDVQDSAEAAFVAMELVEGTTLQGFIAHRGTLTPEEATLVGLAIARALEAAHLRNLLHRDIKPGNVLLGNDGSIKVTDFGIAALMGDVRAARRTVVGTPGYVSPEAATGKPCDARSDLFALGVILYECVTGRNPFHRRSARESLLVTVNGNPPPLARAVPGGALLQELSDLVAALMQKLPQNRPQSAAEVSRLLESLVTANALRWQPGVLEGMPRVMTRTLSDVIPTVTLETERR